MSTGTSIEACGIDPIDLADITVRVEKSLALYCWDSKISASTSWLLLWRTSEDVRHFNVLITPLTLSQTTVRCRIPAGKTAQAILTWAYFRGSNFPISAEPSGPVSLVLRTPHYPRGCCGQIRKTTDDISAWAEYAMPMLRMPLYPVNPFTPSADRTGLNWGCVCSIPQCTSGKRWRNIKVVRINLTTGDHTRLIAPFELWNRRRDILHLGIEAPLPPTFVTRDIPN
jgi:hypothetical protein